MRKGGWVGKKDDWVVRIGFNGKVTATRSVEIRDGATEKLCGLEDWQSV